MKARPTGLTTHVYDNGQIRIPREIRDTYELRPGDKVEFYTTADRMLVIRKVKS
jgi:AbrB family looped-hinge helix DNA binding protein